jgi:hypothetical protein
MPEKWMLEKSSERRLCEDMRGWLPQFCMQQLCTMCRIHDNQCWWHRQRDECRLVVEHHTEPTLTRTWCMSCTAIAFCTVSYSTKAVVFLPRTIFKRWKPCREGVQTKGCVDHKCTFVLVVAVLPCTVVPGNPQATDSARVQAGGTLRPCS